MAIKRLTFDHVKRIERESGDAFWVIAENEITEGFLKGYMYAKFPGKYMDFANTDYSHRVMYEETDFADELGGEFTECNSYIEVVLDLINNHSDINDGVWAAIERSGVNLEDDTE